MGIYANESDELGLSESEQKTHEDAITGKNRAASPNRYKMGV